jgi:CelD/BcsL family acetyltransferase involved in cellulose biosynthesis
VAHQRDSMEYSLRVLKQVEELERVEAGWRNLVESSGHALSEPEWYLSAARSRIGDGKELAVLSLWRHGELAAIAPLARGSSRQRYEFLGSSTLYEPTEMLARDSQASNQLAAAVIDLRRPVLLSRLASRGAFAQELGAQARGKGLLLSLKSADSPYVDLSSGWNSYFEALPSRTRNTLRRASRALAKQGEVAYEFVKPEPSAIPALLEVAFKVEQQSWKGRAGSAIAQREDLRSFFMQYGLQCAARGNLLIAFLRLDGEPIAMQIANVGRNSYRQLKIGYDDRYSRFLPGLQLLLETIRWSTNEGLASYEFMGSREPWTWDWAPLGREHSTLAYYPYNLSGFAAFAGDGLARVQDRFRRHRSPRAASRT